MRGRVLFCLLCLAALTPEGRAAPLDRAAFFESRVRPLLIQRCFGCHSAKAKKSRGGLRLDTRAALLAGGDSGPSVVPGQPERSLLIQAVRHSHPRLVMPPSGKLPPREIAALEEWVRQGAVFP